MWFSKFPNVLKFGHQEVNISKEMFQKRLCFAVCSDSVKNNLRTILGDVNTEMVCVCGRRRR